MSRCHEIGILASGKELFVKKPECTRKYIRIFEQKVTKHQAKSPFRERD